MALLNRPLSWIGNSLSVLALAASGALLIGDTRFWTPSARLASGISAAPLLLVGVSFLCVQPIVRPRWSELIKNMLLAATFLLWGSIQLMPQDAITKRLGDIVIALYVLDLAWMTLAASNPRKGD